MEGSNRRELRRGDYVFAESPEYRRLKRALSAPAIAGTPNPYHRAHQSAPGPTARIEGREILNFASFDYLGMAADPAVCAAAHDAIRRYGVGVSASRLVAGERPIHRDLERELADFLGVDDAIVLPGGHATNETVIGSLFDRQDVIVHDELAHNSVIQGAKLSGALRRVFPHNDWRACDEVLARRRLRGRRALIAVEGVYSMDGDVAPLDRFADLAEAHKAYLMVDEAHALGVVGGAGRGVGELFGVGRDRVAIWMGSLSKALGSAGGFIAGEAEIVEYLRYTAPGYVFATGLAPASAAAALAALRLLREEPGRLARLRENTASFRRRAHDAGLPIGGVDATPIVPVLVGDTTRTLRLAQRLFEEGVNVQPIVYPAVARGAERLRCFVTASHTERQIRRAVGCLAEAWETVGPPAGIAAGIAAGESPEPCSSAVRAAAVQ